MVGWRISKRRYASPPASAFDGEGSRRRGGRWTPPGRRAAYASSSLALASLEYFVNLDPEDAPTDPVSIRVEIPDGVRFEQVSISSISSLPDTWRRTPFPQELWTIGETGLLSASSVCVLVPSAVCSRGSQLDHQPVAFGFQGLAVLGASGVHLRPADVEVIVSHYRHVSRSGESR
jgi:RES domain-containing protein